MKKILTIVMLSLLICATASAERRYPAKPPKYVMYQGIQYRYNPHIKQFFPVGSARERSENRFTMQDYAKAKGGSAPNTSGGIKWWDFYSPR